MGNSLVHDEEARNDISVLEQEVEKSETIECEEEVDLHNKYYIRKHQYQIIPKLREDERVNVSYPLKNVEEDVTSKFYLAATSYYKWQTDKGSMVMSDITIITQHASDDDNDERVRTGLIDRLNNIILAHYIIGDRNTDQRVHEVGGFLICSRGWSSNNSCFHLRKGLAGYGLSLESVTKPGHYIRLVGIKLMLTNRRLQYGETLQEFYNSATFSYEDNNTLINALSKATVNCNYEVTTYGTPKKIYFIPTEVVQRCRYLPDRIYLCCYDGTRVITVDGCEAILGPISDAGLLKVIKTSKGIEFESIIKRGLFLSYTSGGYQLTFAAKSSDVFTEFNVTPGYLGENTYCFEPVFIRRQLLQAEHRIMLSYRSKNEESKRKMTSWTIIRVNE